MNETIHSLPLLCRQLACQAVCRAHVRRWLPRARRDWLRYLKMQQDRHASWQLHRLSRQELLAMHEALDHAREQTMCVEYALAHLERFVESGHMPEVCRATANWNRAERAREKYLEQRGWFERMSLEWRENKAA